MLAACQQGQVNAPEVKDSELRRPHVALPFGGTRGNRRRLTRARQKMGQPALEKHLLSGKLLQPVELS
jgi:hypothetical protein